MKLQNYNKSCIHEYYDHVYKHKSYFEHKNTSFSVCETGNYVHDLKLR